MNRYTIITPKTSTIGSISNSSIRLVAVTDAKNELSNRLSSVSLLCEQLPFEGFFVFILVLPATTTSAVAVGILAELHSESSIARPINITPENVPTIYEKEEGAVKHDNVSR